jgi:hypothetical protein
MGSELIELMGTDEMGASFFKKVSRVVRPLSHSALSLGAKIPIASTYVAGARAGLSLLPGQKSKAATGSNAGPVEKVTAAAGRVPKKVWIGLGVATAVGLGVVALRKK